MYSIILENTVFFYGLTAAISLIVGSFLNVVIYRLPLMMERGWQAGVRLYLQEKYAQTDTAASDQRASMQEAALPAEPEGAFNLAVPASRCPHCNTPIKPWHNIPVLSYLILKGQCASCSARVSLRYPVIEFSTMALSLLVVWQLGPGPQAILGVIVTWFLIAMSVIDFDHQLLPDTLTLPLMWIGLLASLVPVFTDAASAIVGAACGYLILWSIYHVFKLITGKEGMGYGDFKLLAALGALLGWQALPMIILLSSLVGAVVGISLIIFAGRDRNIPMPFGPYLAAAGWIALLWGESISGWYYG